MVEIQGRFHYFLVKIQGIMRNECEFRLFDTAKSSVEYLKYYSGFAYKDIINKEYLRMNTQEKDLQDLKKDVQSVSENFWELSERIHEFMNYQRGNPYHKTQKIEIDDEKLTEKLNQFYAYINYTPARNFDLPEAVSLFEEMFDKYLYKP